MCFFDFNGPDQIAFFVEYLDSNAFTSGTRWWQIYVLARDFERMVLLEAFSATLHTHVAAEMVRNWLQVEMKTRLKK